MWAPLQRAHRGHGMDVVDIDALAAFTMLLSDIQASTPRRTAHPALLLPARFLLMASALPVALLSLTIVVRVAHIF